MLDVEKIKLIIPTSQDIRLVFFSTKIPFQLYSNILNNISNISIKTDYAKNLSVYLINLINLLFSHNGWLIRELMIVFGGTTRRGRSRINFRVLQNFTKTIE